MNLGEISKKTLSAGRIPGLSAPPMLGFGPRTADAVRQLNDALYGQGA